MREEDVIRVEVERLDSHTARKAARLTGLAAPWLRRLGKQAFLLCRLLYDWRRGQYPCPWRLILLFSGALLYFLSPLDVLPDIIPGVGLLDDAALMAMALRLCRDELRAYCRAKGLDAADL